MLASMPGHATKVLLFLLFVVAAAGQAPVIVPQCVMYSGQCQYNFLAMLASPVDGPVYQGASVLAAAMYKCQQSTNQTTCVAQAGLCEWDLGTSTCMISETSMTLQKGLACKDSPASTMFTCQSALSAAACSENLNKGCTYANNKCTTTFGLQLDPMSTTYSSTMLAQFNEIDAAYWGACNGHLILQWSRSAANINTSNRTDSPGAMIARFLGNPFQAQATECTTLAASTCSQKVLSMSPRAPDVALASMSCLSSNAQNCERVPAVNSGAVTMVSMLLLGVCALLAMMLV